MRFIYWGILLVVLAFAGLPVQNEVCCTEALLYSSNTILSDNSSNDDIDLPKKKEEKENKEENREENKENKENKEKEDDRSEEENKFKNSALHTTLYEFCSLEIIQLLDNQNFKIDLLEKWTNALVAPLYILYSSLKINC